MTIPSRSARAHVPTTLAGHFRVVAPISCAVAACALLALAACDSDSEVDSPADAAASSSSSSSSGATSGGPERDSGAGDATTPLLDAASDADSIRDAADATTPFAGATPKLAVGANSVCALKPAGTVWCWGENSQRALGNGHAEFDQPRYYPDPAAVVGPGGVGTLDEVVDLASGDDHVCALRNDGTVWCWGTSQFGALGTGVANVVSAAPVQVQKVGGGALTGAHAVFAGESVSCAIVGPSRTAHCWGWNGYGQLGIGTPGGAIPAAGLAEADGLVPSVSAAARPMLSYNGNATMTNVRSIGIGSGYVCVSSSTIWSGYAEGMGAGGVWCVGQHNADRQLGDGMPADGAGAPPRQRGYPVAVRTPRGNAWLSDVDQVVAGYSHTCVIWDGHVTCWGGGPRPGSAGNPFELEPENGWDYRRANVTPLPGQLLPVGEEGERDMSAGLLSLNNGITCVRVNVVDNENLGTQLATGQVRCAGAGSGLAEGLAGASRNSFGKVVAPEWTTSNANVFLDEVKHMSSGGGAITCVVRNDGGTFCWGPAYGLVGPHESPMMGYSVPTPVLRADGSPFNLLE